MAPDRAAPAQPPTATVGARPRGAQRRVGGERLLGSIVSGVLLVLLTGIPQLGVTLADHDFLPESLSPRMLTGSLLSGNVLSPNGGPAAPTPTRAPVDHLSIRRSPVRVSLLRADAPSLPMAPWQAAHTALQDGPQSGYI